MGYFVFIKSLEGRIFELEVEAGDYIEFAKQKIEELTGIKKDYQRLIFAGLQGI
jgi:hypothetical protein